MPKIQINNAEYYYELHGKGDPVILISGYTSDHLTWLPILGGLSKNFQLLIFDNRGAGRTTDHNDPLTLDLMASDVITLAEKLNLNKPHVVGHSMGGTIAQVIAKSYPEKIRHLVIMTSSSKWRQAALLGLKTSLLMREQNVPFDIIFENIISTVFGEKFLKDKNKVEDLKKRILENPYPQTVENQKRQFKLLESFDGRKDLKNIKAKTLIAYGIEDFLSLPQESKYMAEQISNAELVEFDCGHALTLEAPQKLTETLEKFFQLIQ